MAIKTPLRNQEHPATHNHLLAQARIQRRWTQAVASKRVGVCRSTYIGWENGQQVPTLSTLDLLCQAFGKSPEELGFGSLVSPHRSTPSVSCKDLDTRNLSLIQARMQRRWTQEVASEQAGISRLAYVRLEHGLAEPRLSTLGMLSQAFEMSAHDLGYGHLIPDSRPPEKPITSVSDPLHMDTRATDTHEWYLIEYSSSQAVGTIAANHHSLTRRFVSLDGFPLDM